MGGEIVGGETVYVRKGAGVWSEGLGRRAGEKDWGKGLGPKGTGKIEGLGRGAEATEGRAKAKERLSLWAEVVGTS